MRHLFLLLLLANVALAQTLPDHDITLFQLEGNKLRKTAVISDLPGYDNQPKFLGKSVLFTRIKKEHADMWSWTLKHGAKPLAETDGVGEFSPTPMPDGRGFSTVRLEADQRQRLWRFEDQFELLFKTVEPVGYHAWSGRNVGLFVLGKPDRFEIAQLGSEKTQVVVENIGRCLQKVPERDAVSFTLNEGRHRLVIYNFATGKLERGRILPKGVQDYAWLDSETILTSNGRQLRTGRWDGDEWDSLELSTPLQGITRLAAAADGRVAVVHLKRGWLR